MDVGEEVLRVDAVKLHQPIQGRAVDAIVLFLQAARFARIHIEKARDIGGHARVDLGEEVAMRRIERVVEVEHPRPHMAEIRCFLRIAHGGKMGQARVVRKLTSLL